jgi:hypothetical protein
MIVALITAIIVTAVVYFLAALVVEKMPIRAEFVWLVWLVAILIIVVAWWRLVLEPLIGPLP